MKYAMMAIALMSATPALAQDPNADIPVLTQSDIEKILEEVPQTTVAVTPNAEPEPAPVIGEPVVPYQPEASPPPVYQETSPTTGPAPEEVPASEPAMEDVPATEPIAAAVEVATIEPLPDANTEIMKAAYMAQDEAVRAAAQEVMVKAGTYSDVVDGLYGKKTQAGLIELSVKVFDLTEGQSRYPLTTPEEIAAFMAWLSTGAANDIFN